MNTDVSISENDVFTLTGILGQLLLSFSVYTNGSKILSTHQSAGTLTAINGIRFISMTWIILGHTFVFGFMQGSVGMHYYQIKKFDIISITKLIF